MGARWDRPAPSPSPSPVRSKGPGRRATGPASADATPAPAAPFELVLPQDGPVDPYLRWAVLTGWRGFVRWQDWNLLASGGHLDATSTLRALVRSAATAQRAEPAWETRTLTLAELQQVLDSRALVKLALPLRDASAERLWSAKGTFGLDRDAADFARGLPEKSPLRQGHDAALQPLGEGTLAIVDFGCPFAHAQLRSPDGDLRTRVRRLWDQGGGVRRSPGATVWPWHAERLFGYGREMGPEALSDLTAYALSRGAPDEASVYATYDHLIDYTDARRRVWLATHGGHLLDVLAGWPDPLAPEITSDGARDFAARAPVVFVQLPALTAVDSAGGSLGAFVVDAVRYAMAQVPREHPLVVSISYGNGAGPHDGSSPVEQALAALLRERPDKFAIVVAAGNARQVGCHARRTVRGDRSVLLRLGLAEGDTTDTFVEIWSRPVEGAASSKRQPPALQARLRSPRGAWSPWVAAGEQAVMRDDARSEVVAMLRHDTIVPNGGRPLVFLALSPTRVPAGVESVAAEPGEWQIELRLDPGTRRSDDEQVVDAWIERDDPVRDFGGEPTRFIDQTVDDELDTLSSLATAHGVVRAGGFNLESGLPAPYSSLPAEAEPSLMVLAACEETLDDPTVRAAATRSPEVYRLNGTSVAAPVVARALFNAMMAKTDRSWTGADVADELERLVREQPGRFRAYRR